MGDSEAGSIISFGAVALLAVLGYKKLESLFSGGGSSSSSQPAETATKIIEVAGGTKETVKEVIVQATGSGTQSGQFDPFSWYGIFGTQEPEWYKKLTGTDTKADAVKPAQNGVSKTYGTGDAEYDKYVDSLTDQWTANLKAAQEKNLAARAAQDVPVYSSDSSGKVIQIGTQKYTEVVAASKSNNTTTKSADGVSSIKRQGGNGTGEDKVRIIKKVMA